MLKYYYDEGLDAYEQFNQQRLLSEAQQADDEIEQLGRWLEGQPKDE